MDPITRRFLVTVQGYYLTGLANLRVIAAPGKLSHLYQKLLPAMLISRFDDSLVRSVGHRESPRFSDFHASPPFTSCFDYSKHSLPSSGITGLREKLACDGIATSI